MWHMRSVNHSPDRTGDHRSQLALNYSTTNNRRLAPYLFHLPVDGSRCFTEQPRNSLTVNSVCHALSGYDPPTGLKTSPDTEILHLQTHESRTVQGNVGPLKTNLNISQR